MHICLNSKPMRRAGSIILEIAIVTPVFLLLGAFMLTAISCARADILFAQAVDQVTQEIAVVLPLAGAGIDLAGDALYYINEATALTGGSTEAGSSESTAEEILQGVMGGVGALLDEFGIQGEDLFGTLLFGEAIRNRIVDTFNTYNESESLLHSRIENVSVYVDYDEPNKAVWLHVYYQWNTLFGYSDKMIMSCVPIFGDLELTLPETTDVTDKEDKVWLLNNFERGYSLRSTYGANLPSSYPVIGKWESGTATSIKSIDLTAPGYQISRSLTSYIQELISDLSEFNGTAEAWGKDNILITGDQITSRVLVIIIPANSSEEVYNELVTGLAFASACGVQTQIEKYGNSYRYIKEESSNIEN